MKEEDTLVKILLFTAYEKTDFLLQAFDLGVDGYILKKSNSKELKKAINIIISGDSYIQPSLLPLLNSRLISRNLEQKKIKLLTKREMEILIQVAGGMFNKEIAINLNISERTVKNHLSNIFKKIDVSDRTQAAVFAIRNNIVQLY